MTVIDLLSKLMLLRDKGFTVIDYQSTYDMVDTAFRAWMAQRYASLATSADVNQPVMLHHVPDFVRRTSKKPAVIVIDGMNFVDSVYILLPAPTHIAYRIGDVIDVDSAPFNF